MNQKIFCVGNAIADNLVHISDDELAETDFPKGGMTLVDENKQAEIKQKFSDRDVHFELGGSAMNTARTIALLGGDVSFYGMVGPDILGDKILTRMGQVGVKSYLKRHSTQLTGSCFVMVTPDGERTMATNLGASCLYNQDMLPQHEIVDSKVFHVTGYQWSSDHQKAAILAAAQTAKEHGREVSFDVADPFMVGLYKDQYLEFIDQYATIVFANQEEARALYGSTDVALREIAKTSTVVIKLGADGARIKNAHEEVLVNAHDVKVIDTTGAGDMFAGGFLQGFLSGFSLENSGRLAALMASEVIKNVGAILKPEAVEAANQFQSTLK